MDGRGQGGMEQHAASISVEREGDRLRASVRGSLTGAFADRAKRQLARAVAAGPAPREVLVDLRGCRIIDSLGLRALRNAADGTPLALTGADPFLEVQLQLLGAAPLVRTTPRSASRADPRTGARPSARPDAPRPPRDRRRHRRVRADHPAELRLQGPGPSPFSASVCDASEGGLGLRPTPTLRRLLAEALQAPGVLEVRCPALLGAGWTRCRTVLHKGLGLELQDLAPATRARLRDLARAG